MSNREPSQPMEGAPAETRQAPAAVGAQPASPALVVPQMPMRQARSDTRRAFLVGGVVLLFHAVVAAWALWPARAPEEQLASAARERDRSGREAKLEGLVERETVQPDQLVRAAGLLLEVDGFTTLREVAREFQRVAPSDLRGPLWEARAELELHMFDEARAALARAERLAPQDLRPLELLAEVGVRAHDDATALRALSRAWALEGAPPSVGLRLGILLRQAGRLEEAAAVLSQVQAPETLADARAELAFVLHHQGQHEEARALLAHTTAQHPDSALAHHYLGAVLHTLGEDRAAEAAWRRADALEPDEPKHLAALCELIGRDSDRARDARALANLFRRRFPGDASRIGGACFGPRATR